MNYCYYVLRTPHYFLLTNYYTTHDPPLAHCLLPHHRVAKVLLAALVHPCYRDRSFDLRAKPVGDPSTP